VIKLKTKEEIKIMREAGMLCASIMNEVLEKIRPGTKTIDIDKKVDLLCRRYKIEPAFKGYNGYRYSSCTCVNEEIVHGIPSEVVLLEGDILSLDFGVFHKGFYSDHAKTVGIGEISKEMEVLISTTRICLLEAALSAREGNHIGDIGYAIHKTALMAGFDTIGAFGGHGIGEDLHEEPFVANFGFKGEEELIVEGMVLAIEPLVSLKKCDYQVLEDGWTVISHAPLVPVAHFEDVIAITSNGPEILTRI
jgi:methionyl aminopeptidase